MIRIIIEGPQGMGKTFIANLISKALISENIETFGDDLTDALERHIDYGSIEIITTNHPLGDFTK